MKELNDEGFTKTEPFTNFEDSLGLNAVENEHNSRHRKQKHVTYAENVKVKEEPMSIEEDSIFPNDIFEKLDLKNDEQYLTPVKLEVEENTNKWVDSNSRKSAKRTVFPRESPYKTRQSPYKRNTDDNTSSKSFSSKKEIVDIKTVK